MNSSFRNAWFRFFFRFCKLRQLRVCKTTKILSTVLGIPSSYFSSQRLMLKLIFGTMNASFRNAWFRTFFPFLQVEAVACLEKTIILYTVLGIPTSYFFKSKIKVEINHWDHEFQFPECLIPHFSPFLQVEAVACLQKTIILSNVLGIPSSYFSNQRLKLRLTWTMNSSFRNAQFRTFFRFCKLRQLRVQKKTIILSNVLGIPSSYFSNQTLTLNLTIGTMNSSFWNAWFRTFFRCCKLRQLRVWKKTIILSTVLGIPSSYF